MHEHRPISKTKIIRIGMDRHHQLIESCAECLLQLKVRVVELKKGPYRGSSD